MRTMHASSIILGVEKYSFILNLNIDSEDDGIVVHIAPDLTKKVVEDLKKMITDYEEQHGEIDVSKIESLTPDQGNNGEKEYS